MTTPVTVGTVIELEAGQVAQGGSCVARHEGLVVFVRHALPGERVRAVVTEERPHHLRADAVEILEPSPDRVRAPCPYAGPGLCGGCDWQHATLAAQRRLKASVVEEQLRRLARIERRVNVEEVPGDPSGLGWRTRVRFTVREDGVVGLRKHRSHEVQPIDACLIAHPGVEDVGVERRRWPKASSVEAVAAVGTGDRALIVSPSHRGGEIEVPPLDAPTSLLRDAGRGRTERLRGRPGVREVALDRTWRVGGSAFWQVHPAAVEVLADAVLAGLAPRVGESVLDLYCGVGVFAGALAVEVGPTGRVTGVEANPGAAADARHNLRDLPYVQLVRGRVPEVLPRLGLRRADLVVLDPPRAGAGRDVVAWLSKVQTRRTAYVSCDPAPLARDLAYFAEHGWGLADLRAFDIFPMTHHVECVAILTRDGA